MTVGSFAEEVGISIMDGSTARRPPRAPLDEACARKLSASSASGPPSARYGKLVALAQSLSASAAANANASAAGGEGGGGGASDAAGTGSVPPLPPKTSSSRGSGAGPSGAPASATATQLAATSGGAPGPVGVLGATARHAKPPSRGRAQSGDLEIFALVRALRPLPRAAREETRR